MLRLTLAARIGLIVLVSLSLVWVVSVAVFYRTHADELEGALPAPARIVALAELAETLTGEQRGLALEAASSGWFRPRLVAAGQAMPASAGSVIAAALHQRYSSALAARPLGWSVEALSPPARWFSRLAATRPGGVAFRIPLRTGETLVINTGGPPVFTRFGLPVGFGAGMLGTLVAVIALLIMQRETRPLARLARAVDQLDSTTDPVVLPEARRSAPEIRAVIGAFGRLQQRLHGLIQARMALLGGISHDVRTFATRLRLRVEGIADESERQRAIADIEDMVHLLDDALLSSRAGAGELSQEMVEIGAVVRHEVDDRRAQGAAADLVCAAGAADAVVLGDRIALRRIVANIIDNALKYGHAAHVAAAIRKGWFELDVDDDGPGIPPDQRELMLQPFSRLEASRNRGTGGAGLGLAVVRTLTEAHGGKVTIADAPGGGARISLRLPLFRSDGIA